MKPRLTETSSGALNATPVIQIRTLSLEFVYRTPIITQFLFQCNYSFHTFSNYQPDWETSFYVYAAQAIEDLALRRSARQAKNL
jgi:hypothetical protein